MMVISSMAILPSWSAFVRWMNGIEVVVHRLYVVVVDCNKCIVGLPVPEEDKFAGTDGIVASGVVGKGRLFKLFHVDV